MHCNAGGGLAVSLGVFLGIGFWNQRDGSASSFGYAIDSRNQKAKSEETLECTRLVINIQRLRAALSHTKVLVTAGGIARCD